VGWSRDRDDGLTLGSPHEASSTLHYRLYDVDSTNNRLSPGRSRVQNSVGEADQNGAKLTGGAVGGGE